MNASLCASGFYPVCYCAPGLVCAVGIRSCQRCVSRHRVTSVVSHCVPRVAFPLFGILRQRPYGKRRDAGRRFTMTFLISFSGSSSQEFDSCDGVGTIGITALGVGSPESFHVASGRLYSFHSESYVGVGIGVATLGVSIPDSCHTSSRDLFSLYSECYFGIGTIGVATLCVGIPESCRTSSRVSSSQESQSHVGVATTGFSTLGVDFLESCRTASR